MWSTSMSSPRRSPAACFRIDADVGDAVEAGETVIATIRPTDPAFLERAVDGRGAGRRALGRGGARPGDCRRGAGGGGAGLRGGGADPAPSSWPSAARSARQTLERRQLDYDTKRAAVAQARAALRVAQANLETVRAALIAPGEGGGGDASECCVEVRSPVDGNVLSPAPRERGRGRRRHAAGRGRRSAPAGGGGRIAVLRRGPGDGGRSGDRDRLGWPAAGCGGAPGRAVSASPRSRRSGLRSSGVNAVLDLTAAPSAYAALGHGLSGRCGDHRLARGGGRRPSRWARSTGRAGGLGGCSGSSTTGAVSRRASPWGRRNQDRAQVLEGLAAGGTGVILHPGEAIGDGARVRRPPDRLSMPQAATARSRNRVDLTPLFLFADRSLNERRAARRRTKRGRMRSAWRQTPADGRSQGQPRGAGRPAGQAARTGGT